MKALTGLLWVWMKICKRTPSSHQTENQGTLWFLREILRTAITSPKHGCRGKNDHLSSLPSSQHQLAYAAPSELTGEPSVGLQYLTGCSRDGRIKMASPMSGTWFWQWGELLLLHVAVHLQWGMLGILTSQWVVYVSILFRHTLLCWEECSCELLSCISLEEFLESQHVHP